MGMSACTSASFDFDDLAWTGGVVLNERWARHWIRVDHREGGRNAIAMVGGV
jgi:hypothetical protein